jgi:hypothetical protein
MDTGSTSAYVGACRKDLPYPSVSHESVPSLIDNLVYALYGTITKTVVDRRVQWYIPCDPNNTSTINNIPRNAGEGLLCYIIRALNTTGGGIVTINATQTLLNKTLDASCSLLGNALTATTAVSATNLLGGLAGSLPYQTSAGHTAFLSQGTNGQFLSCNGSGNIAWTTLSSLPSATNIAGGVAGAVVYQSGVGTTGFTAAGTTGQVLVSNGTSSPTWSTNIGGNAATATTSTNIASGVAGAVPYQSGVGATAFTAAGTTGQVLISNGTSSPTWSTNIAGQAGSVANGSVTPVKLSTGGPSWDTSGNVTVSGTGNSSFAGGVGIGTSSPAAKLDVYGNNSSGVVIRGYNADTSSTSNVQIQAQNGNGVSVQLQAYNNIALVNCVSATPLEFRTSNATRIQIGADGTINAQGNPITNCLTTAKAWVYFNAVGTINVKGSNNVSSVTKSGAGNYTITFTTAMTDANYAVAGMIGTSSESSATGAFCFRLKTLTTANVNVVTGFGAGATGVDATNCAIMIFGN